MCDRTLEFNKIIAEQHSGESVAERKAPASSSLLRDDAKSREAFHHLTLDVSKGIQNTAASLSKLTKLVRQQGLFDDPTEEINKLVYKIKQDLTDLNFKCDAAQQNVDERKRQYGERNQINTHSNSVVSQLKTGLMAATKDFKTTLEIRSSKMKDTQNRKSQISGNGMLSPLRQFSANTSQQTKVGESSAEKKPVASVLPTPYNDAARGGSYQSPQMIPQSSLQQQQQLLLAPPASMQYYESREVAVNEVEKTIGELGQLFKRLGGMIMEQQELIERIDEDVENAVSTADKAHNALLKTYESVASNRALYMKVGSILAAFVIFFVMFLM